jgi:thioredoxin-like negative regulator of GroEL
VLEGGLAFAPDSVELRIELGFLHLKRNDRTNARTMLVQRLRRRRSGPMFWLHWPR